MGYNHVEIDVTDGVGWLWLNRPEKLNAMSEDMWADIPAAVGELDADESVRVIVVAGRGKAFTVGIDLTMLGSLDTDSRSEAEKRAKLYAEIKRLQHTMSAFANSPKPTIAAVHGYCLGAGIDLITACDIRIASSDATFSVRETKMGLVADVGTMQRLPKIIAPGHVAELVFTGRDIDAAEAARIGLVNRVHDDAESMTAAVHGLAQQIAANSPLVVQGAKRVLAAEADMSTEAALDHVALWNSAFLWSNDLVEAMMAFRQKRPPNYTGT
jgi:enoyl-CoA hydratase